MSVQQLIFDYNTYKTTASFMYIHLPQSLSQASLIYINVTSITSTSISLSWSVPSGSVVTSYEVMWRALSRGDEANDDRGSGTIVVVLRTSTSYTIQELKSLTIYNITLTVINAAGNAVSRPIITGQ